MGRPSTKVYVIDAAGALRALLPERGLFRMTHLSCALVKCPHCGAPAGEACRGAEGQPTTSTHVDRKNAAGAKKGKKLPWGP